MGRDKDIPFIGVVDLGCAAAGNKQANYRDGKANVLEHGEILSQTGKAVRIPAGVLDRTWGATAGACLLCCGRVSPAVTMLLTHL